MNKFQQRAEEAELYWHKLIQKASPELKQKNLIRVQGVRKRICDSAMRYTMITNKACLWAQKRYEETGKLPMTISPQLPSSRQEKLLIQLASNPFEEASWIKDLKLSDKDLDNLSDVGERYNAQWLLNHDIRWGIAIINAVVERMRNAGF